MTGKLLRIKKISVVRSLAVLLFTFYHACYSSEYILFDTIPGAKFRSDFYMIGNGFQGLSLSGGIQRDSVLIRDITLVEGSNARYFGALRIDNEGTSSSVSEYKRALDIGEAVATQSYTNGGKKWSREYFASYPDTVAVLHYRCVSPQSVSCTLSIAAADSLPGKTISASGNAVTLSGKFNKFEKWDTLRYVAKAYIKKYNGSVAVQGNSIRVTGADSVTVYFTSATNFKLDRSAGYRTSSSITTLDNICKSRIDHALSKPLQSVKSDHIADHKRLFDRFYINFDAPVNTNIPTRERIRDFTVNSTKDRGLVALHTQFGRYLLIASSRYLCAGLQGNWTDKWTPDWGGAIYTNINLQMNYWGAEPTGLQELSSTLIPVFYEWSKRFTDGKYWLGRTSGYSGDFGWAEENSNFAWMMLLMWDHYQYGGDKSLLESKIYPLMKGAGRFYLDKSKVHPESGGKYFIKQPLPWADDFKNYSSENGYDIATACGQQGAIMTYQNTIRASEILDRDKDVPGLRDSMKTFMSKTDNGIWKNNEKGLLEFFHGIDGQEGLVHRHLSHLYGLYPGDLISPLIDKQIADNAALALIKRGDDKATAWAYAARAATWTRLWHNNNYRDSAYSKLTELIKYRTTQNLWGDMFNSVMQFDANGGAVGATAEMLAQSNIDSINILLPALSSKIPKGEVRGLRLKHNKVISKMNWSNGKLDSAYIHSYNNSQITILNYIAGQSIPKVYITDSTTGVNIATTTSDRNGYTCTHFVPVDGRSYKIKTTGSTSIQPSLMNRSSGTFITSKKNGKNLILQYSSGFNLAESPIAIYSVNGKVVRKLPPSKPGVVTTYTWNNPLSGIYIIKFFESAVSKTHKVVN